MIQKNYRILDSVADGVSLMGARKGTLKGGERKMISNLIKLTCQPAVGF